MNDDISAALLRVKHAMDALNAGMKQGSFVLSDLAKLVVAADELHSALSLIFDDLYEGNKALGNIERRSIHLPGMRRA